MLSKLFSDSLLLIVVRVGGMLASMLLMIVLARRLSTTEFGLVTIGFSTALMFGLAVTLNYGSGAIRFLNKYKADGSPAAAGHYVTTGRRITAAMMVALWMIAATLYFIDLPFLNIPESVIFGLFAAPLFGWIRLESAYTIAAGNVLRGSLPGMLVRPLLVLSIVGLAIFASAPLTSTSVMLILILSLALVCIWQVSFFKGTLGLETGASSTPANTESNFTHWTGMGLQLVIPMLFLELSIDTIVLLTATFLSADDVAVISVVMRIQAIILFGVTSINMAVGPKIAQAFSGGDQQLVKRLIKLSGQLKFWPSLLVLGGLYLFGEMLLGVFGDQYRAHLGTLMIVGATPLVNAFYGPTVLFMTLLEQQKAGNLIFLAALILLAVCVAIFGNLFGTQGVAAAVLIVWLAWNHALYYLIRQRGGIDTSILSLLRK